MGTRVKIVELLEQETKSCKGNMNGLWRSLVAHLTGGQGVAGSNPVNPTSLIAGQRFIVSDLFYLRPRDCEKWHGNFVDTLNPESLRALG